MKMGVFPPALSVEVSLSGAMRTVVAKVLHLATALIVQSPALIADKPRLMCYPQTRV